MRKEQKAVKSHLIQSLSFTVSLDQYIAHFLIMFKERPIYCPLLLEYNIRSSVVSFSYDEIFLPFHFLFCLCQTRNCIGGEISKSVNSQSKSCFDNSCKAMELSYFCQWSITLKILYVHENILFLILLVVVCKLTSKRDDGNCEHGHSCGFVDDYKWFAIDTCDVL